MPSGRAHDQITIVTAALSLPVWWMVSPVQDAWAYCAGVAAYIFSGFYLSSDLDTKSVAIKRWGVFKFLWYPYQRLVPHRSWVSHGIGVGPIVRAVYFAAALWLFARCALWLIDEWIIPVNRDSLILAVAVDLAKVVFLHRRWAEWALGGLVLGGLAHTMADAIVSGFKRHW